jgi:dTDP-4-dehydrorhamnose 3,5-epimerase
MQLQATTLRGAFLVEARAQLDQRGAFARLWDPSAGATAGLTAQLNLLCASWNPVRGTLRGMHWQEAPAEEVKLVRCTRGRIFDAAVDVRTDSDSYLSWWGTELGAGDGRAVYLSAGLAHGFLTLTDDTEVEYLMTSTYDPSRARGLRYDDPAVSIAWPTRVEQMSERDAGYPLLGR